MEYREQTIARLTRELGREPTAEEIKAARDAIIRQRYADMAVSAILLRDETEHSY
jgi:hypothetical protein